MDRVQRSIVERVRRYGLRVMCARCSTAQRHYPQSGRLRDARCINGGCGGELRAVAWIDRHPGRWGQLVSETAERLRPFAR